MEKMSAMINKTRIVTLFIIIFTLNYSPTIGQACSCVGPATVEERVGQSSAVFTGKVVDIVDLNTNKSVKFSSDSAAIYFEVDESWKGLAQTEVIAYTENSSLQCGYAFSLNESYLVYAYEIDGELWVGACSGTTPLSTAQKDIDELGVGLQPKEEVALNLKKNQVKDQIFAENSSSNTWIYVLLLIAGFLVVGGYWIRRNKQK